MRRWAINARVVVDATLAVIRELLVFVALVIGLVGMVMFIATTVETALSILNS